jgi:glutathione synthase/RimK-type ligase-like ATP-grasp enzyme
VIGNVSALIIAPNDDDHAWYVSDHIAGLGHKSRVVGLEEYPRHSIRLEGSSPGVLSADLLEISMEEVDVVWWRRPLMPEAPGEVWDPRMREFIVAEWRHSLLGLFHSLGCPIVNDPMAEAIANYKVCQLASAKASGLLIPETSVTNEIQRVDSFAHTMEQQGSNVVYKPLTSPTYHMAETRQLSVADLDEAELRLSPVIFQECIEKGEDIRVTIIGDRIFGAAVETTHSDLVDWRLDPLARFKPYDLPESLERNLLSFMRRMRLDTGSLDLRRDPQGRFYFLEVNPSGQFLFLEGEIGIQLGRTLARYLVMRGATRRTRPRRLTVQDNSAKEWSDRETTLGSSSA